MTNLLISLVLGVQPYVPRTKERENFRVRWKKKFHRDHPDIVDEGLNIYGLCAYDATMALAMAIEEAGTTNFGFQRANDWIWTPDKGLVKKLKSATDASSKANLASIVWPGDSISVPKGWEIPINGKRVRIGVPVKVGFTEFVEVTKDPITNETKVTGYCIDVFNAVMKGLPYPVAYDYIPFALPNGSRPGNHNDLVYQVCLGAFRKGSQLVPDVSGAILKATGCGNARIEDAWLGEGGKFPDSSNSISSSVLGIDSFWGFLIAGAISLSSHVCS
ncbi:hypothetical protein GH714_036764 [Hevea brasiliensis]|uniref:Ionotropic glutamate receptor C-terminal domain-containing protein n=1 Tax=Hevea brasiliensis TaxID=3981 RepID=A0A6A6NF48_HEVBR|nr:hypothetical protein GH714_036764 [Hevea brasiliensis]